ncbi:MAG: type II toxin-antitoxin system death-on-curing family toxin, partial [Actinomycetota bacterium]|nr:type II toxin-antitoxin system death-on-curing family toxin [Actinomycetota bacterium]
MIFLDLEDLLHVAERATGGPVEVRDIGLLESAAG